MKGLAMDLINYWIALLAILFWPLIPIFWIPVHGATGIFKKLGFFSYFLLIGIWLAIAFLLYRNRTPLLRFVIGLPEGVPIAGMVLFSLGVLIHIWTGWLLGGLGLIGVPELFSTGGKLVRKGPFALVRHPTYLAHSLMFLGAFLITGTISVGLIAAFDFTVTNAVIIPLEERELARRFGEEYNRYRKETRRLIPYVF